MRLQQRNVKPVKWKTFLGKKAIMDAEGYETGEYELEYGELQEAKMSVSAYSGSRSGLTASMGGDKVESFGISESYDRILLCEDLTIDINAESKVYITERTGEKEYIVKKIAESLNVLAIAVRRAMKDEESN